MEITMVTCVGIIIELGELAKMYLPTKFIPLVAVTLGVIGGIFVLPGDTLVSGIFTGLAMGLSACGLFDLGKSVLTDLCN